MRLRGLEILLATLGGVLSLIAVGLARNGDGTVSSLLSALIWALIGLAPLVAIDFLVVRCLLPHYGATWRLAKVAARIPGLRLLSDGGRSVPRVRGTFGGCSVRIDCTKPGWKTIVRPIHRDDRADVQVSLLSASMPRGSWRTGDPTFDRTVHVHGQLPEGLLVLDRPTREVVRRALSRGIGIDTDHTEWSGGHVLTPSSALDHLTLMSELTRRLYALTPTELRARARTTIECDPYAEVRARTLWLYQEHYPLTSEDQATVEAAMNDEHPLVRLAAAGALIVAHPTSALAEAMLAEAVARGECPDWAIDAALARLLEHGRPEVVNAALQARLRDRGPMPVEAVRWFLGQPPGLSPAPMVIGRRLVAAPEPDALNAIPVILAAGPAWEETLLALLDHDSERVADHTLDALAFEGTVRAIPALERVARDPRRPRRLRHAAQDALTAVRARRPPEGGGRLSLTDPTSTGGRVSMAD